MLTTMSTPTNTPTNTPYPGLSTLDMGKITMMMLWVLNATDLAEVSLWLILSPVLFVLIFEIIYLALKEVILALVNENR